MLSAQVVCPVTEPVFEVRDVHYTHYGRMCPIETPEGPNIGLIVSLANFTRVNDYGFLETPFRKVEKGKVSHEVEYLSAMDEEKYFIAQASASLDKDWNLTDDLVAVRRSGDYTIKKPDEIKYMDVSPRQIISTAASLIPFLEHEMMPTVRSWVVICSVRLFLCFFPRLLL